MKENEKRVNIVHLILSVVIAVLLWFYVIAKLNPDTTDSFKGMDIQIIGTDRLAGNGLAIVDGGNATADVTVSGKRNRIRLVKADKFTLTASVESITTPGKYNLNYNISVDVADVSVAAKKPSQVTITVDRISSKTVPANITFSGTMPKDFLLDSFKLTPDAIVVTGPETKLQEIKSAEIAYNITNLDASLDTTLAYELFDEEGEKIDMTGLSVDTPAIVLSMDVKCYAMVPLYVNIIPTADYPADMVKLTIAPATIKIVGDPDVIKLYKRVSLGSMSIKPFINNRITEISFDIVLPNGIEEADGQTKADVTITTPGYVYIERFIPFEYFEQFAERKIKYAAGSGIMVLMFGPEDIAADIETLDLKISPLYLKDINGENAVLNLEVDCFYEEMFVLGSYSMPVTLVE